MFVPLFAPGTSVLLFAGVIESTLESFRADVVAALPRLLSGLVFVTAAYVTITILTRPVRSVLERVYPDNEQLIVEFAVLVVGTFSWFGAALVLLNVVGLGAVAASLGTAVGFLALGVSYALSDMIEDTVAGVYHRGHRRRGLPSRIPSPGSTCSGIRTSTRAIPSRPPR